MEKQKANGKIHSVDESIIIQESKPDVDNNVTVRILRGSKVEATVILERFTEDEIDFIKEINRIRRSKTADISE